MPHDVIFLLVPGFQLLDMSGPAAVFQTAGKQARTTAGPAYAVHVVSERGGPVRSSCGVEVLTRSWRDAPPGTLVVPGGEGARAAAVTPAMRRYLHAHRQAGRRLASVCTGAFVLAAAGLLDGRRATTTGVMPPSSRATIRTCESTPTGSTSAMAIRGPRPASPPA